MATSNQKPIPSNGITLSGDVDKQVADPVVGPDTETPEQPAREPGRPKYRLDEELLDARPRVVPLFIIPGFKTHIVAFDPQNPGVIRTWIQHGWEEIMPENADPTQAVQESIDRGHVLTNNRCALGGGLIGIPMKIPEQYYELSMKKLEALNNSKLASIDGKRSLKEEANDDDFYGTRDSRGRGVNLSYAR